MKTSKVFQLARMVLGLCIAVCASTATKDVAGQGVTVTSGPFRNAALISKELKRGFSSREDVRRLLGPPNGAGGMIAASFGSVNQDVWYYENIEMTGAQSASDAVRLGMRQQIMLVFFKGEKFDGYLWTTNAGAGEVR